MLRILHVVTYMGRGGLETMLMNYYRKIDRTKIQFDFLVHRDFEADYDREIEELGGKIYRLPRLNPFSSRYLDLLDQFFKDHKEYKIVHSHLDCVSCVPLKYAQKNGIPVRIAHAHSSNQTKDKKYILKLFLKRKIKKYATVLLACSKKAGKWMFKTDDFMVINNAIDTSRYVYSFETASAIRETLGINSGDFVVGHVGRFDPPKNHEFIVDVFYKLCSIKDNAKLVLVGEGSLRPKIEEKVKSLGIDDKVIFTGLRSDVADILQAMDVFLFPSIYEGLPVSIVEAQAAGLPCLISDKVPLDCKITDHIYTVNLEDGVSIWADKVLSFSDFNRPSSVDSIIQAGFDICSNAEYLQNFYLEK